MAKDRFSIYVQFIFRIFDSLTFFVRQKKNISVFPVIIKLKYCRRKMDFSLLLEMKNRKPS